jgi:sulfate permease, SulP family
MAFTDDGNGSQYPNYGRVLLFYLSGPMIFGVAKAIAREHSAMADCDVLIMDLSDVPMLGVTASLAVENAIKDAAEQGRQVFLVGATGNWLVVSSSVLQRCI